MLFQARDLDAYFSLEETILTRGAQDRDSILELIGVLFCLELFLFSQNVSEFLFPRVTSV